MLPEYSLKFIQRCVNERKLRWTYHADMQMRDRTIDRQTIIDSVNAFEVIEEYPDDKYLPSYLVYSRYGSLVIHVLFAVDVYGDNVRVVTAYSPNLVEWKNDMRTRRRRV